MGCSAFRRYGRRKIGLTTFQKVAKPSNTKGMGMESSKIDSATIAAYRAAHYEVLEPDPFVLHVGLVSTRLADLLMREQASCVGFITAWNPFSENVTEADNSAAQSSLMKELIERGFSTVPGFGKDPSGKWPSEESLLVIGLSLEEVKQLGIKYRQNAVIWSGEKAVPELILLR
jgi:hypothetical protein